MLISQFGGHAVLQLWDTLLQLFQVLGQLVVVLLQLLLQWSLVIGWIAWWLWGVNWKKAWVVLAEGAWVPLLLVLVMSALVWSQLSPSTMTVLGVVTLANFWWQLGALGLLVCAALFCGWLQGAFGWAPAELNLEPPAHAGHEGAHAHH